jgi:hypothetical protein
MSSSDLIRLGGMAAVVGGVLFVIGDLIGLFTLGVEVAETAATGAFFVQQLLFLLGTVLILFGLFGLYDSQSEATGILGLVGFLIAFLGTALAAGAGWAQAFISPRIAELAPRLLEVPNFAFPLLFAVFAVGWLLFGIATLRAGVYPRAAAILLIVGAVLTFVAFLLPASAFVLGIGVAWLGFVLFTRAAHRTSSPHA